MKNYLLVFVLIFISAVTSSATVVTNITASYHDGQTFIVWDIIAGYGGFYYVYRYDHPINNNNIDSAKYMGKVPHDFSFNYFLNLATNPGTQTRFLVINRNPLDSLNATKGLFVTTCSAQKTVYYAVTSDSINLSGVQVENKYMLPGSNAMTAGIAER